MFSISGKDLRTAYRHLDVLPFGIVRGHHPQGPLWLPLFKFKQKLYKGFHNCWSAGLSQFFKACVIFLFRVSEIAGHLLAIQTHFEERSASTSERQFNIVLEKFSFVSMVKIEKQFDSTVEWMISTGDNDSEFALKSAGSHNNWTDCKIERDLWKVICHGLIPQWTWTSTDRQREREK